MYENTPRELSRAAITLLKGSQSEDATMTHPPVTIAEIDGALCEYPTGPCVSIFGVKCAHACEGTVAECVTKQQSLRTHALLSA